jgi:hypothetical protein
MLQDSNNKESLYRVDLKSGEFKQIVPVVEGRPQALSLSADDKILYVRTFFGPPAAGQGRMDRVMAIDLSNGQQRNIATVSAVDAVGAASAGSLILSPDNKTLYTKACDPPAGLEFPHVCRRIVAVDVSTGQQRTVLTVQDSDQIPQLGGFALSADGHDLAIVSTPKGDVAKSPEGKFHLIRVAVDGSGYRNLYEWDSRGVSFNPNVSWTPNGAAIMLSGSQPTDDGILRFQAMQVPANGGNPKAINSASDNWDGFVLSPDGARAAVSVNEAARHEVWALDNIASYLKTAR